MRAPALLFAALLVSAGVTGALTGLDPPTVPPAKTATEESLASAAPGAPSDSSRGVASIPVLFAAASEGFVAHAAGTSARFLPGEVAFTRADGTWTLQLLGAPTARPEAGAELGGVANWYLGNEPAKWRVGTPMLASIVYREAWPGIDVVFYGDAGRIKYDVVVQPGADLATARFAIPAAALEILPDGSLRAQVGMVTAIQPAPTTYQNGPSGREIVASWFVHDGANFGFQVGAHDSARALVIDPALDYSSYLAGSGTDVAWAVQVDAAGAMYVTGESQSPDLYPGATPGDRRSMSWTTDHNHEATNVFVAKITANGAAYEWGTFIGGAASPEPDTAYALALDRTGSIFLTGYTHSPDFPVNLTGYQPALRSVHSSGSLTLDRSHDLYDAFVAKVGPAGQLQFATFLGGGGEDFGYAIDIDDRNGDVVVAGETTSLDFPVTANAYQKTGQGGGNLQKDTWTFVTRFVSWGNGPSDVSASTILGSYAHVATYDLDLDASGRPWFVGYKYVADRPLPTPGAPNNVPNTNGTKNLFVSAFEPNLDKLHYTARLGGDSDDRAFGVKVVGGANGAEPLVYVTGQSSSSNLPVTDGSTARGGSDVFVLKLDPGQPAGQHIVYFTRFGGRDDDVGRAIEVDAQGQAYVAGNTGGRYYFAPKWPTTDGTGGTLVACQGATARGQEAILAILNANGTMRYATYLGGRGHDAAEELALAPDGKVILVGQTSSPNFPTTNGAIGTGLAAGKDAFIARIDPTAGSGCPATPAALADPCVTWQPPAAVTIPYNSARTLTVGITNCGRTLNSGLAGNPQHYLHWSIYSVGPNGHWEWDSGENPTSLPSTGTIAQGNAGTAQMSVRTTRCWNGNINVAMACDPGMYEIHWDIVEANPSDPLIPNTLFSQQAVRAGITQLTISVV